MFNFEHLMYIGVSTLLTIVGLILLKIFVKTNKAKQRVIKICGWLCLITHLSIMWVDYFANGVAQIGSDILLLMYPCNIMMDLMIVCGYLPMDKKFSKAIFEFTCYAGIVCGIIGVVFNTNYDATPTLAYWHSFKGLLSHSFFLFGSLYMLVGGFFEVRISNCLPVLMGLLFFVFVGYINNGLFALFNLGEPNSMYLQHPPFENLPWLTPWTMGLLGLLLLFIVLEVYELIALKRQDRTLYKLFNRRNK